MSVASGVVMAGSGGRHSCLLDTSQAVKCAGQDTYGKLGDGAGQTPNSDSFNTVSGLAAASTISLGTYHTCAMLLSDGSIMCWGNGISGKLGTGSTANEFVPVPATELNSGANIQLVTSISASATYVDFTFVSLSMYSCYYVVVPKLRIRACNYCVIALWLWLCSGGNKCR
jgi:alpha-tubulin suppressor-like RCC1 family protein